MQKIFVITDERCGGTELGHLFKILGYKVIDDPQTPNVNKDITIYNKDNVLNNIEYFFTIYDYVKICMVSYTLDNYTKIIDKVVTLGCKIVFLWRKNYLERGLSKLIAIETGVWHKKDYNKVYKGVFRLDSNMLGEIIDDNKKKILYISKYLDGKGIKYYPLLYENIYNINYNADQRVSIFMKVLEYVGYSIKSITKEQYGMLTESVCPCKKVNSLDTYNRITNINEIIKEFSNNENGIIKLNKNYVNIDKKCGNGIQHNSDNRLRVSKLKTTK